MPPHLSHTVAIEFAIVGALLFRDSSMRHTQCLLARVLLLCRALFPRSVAKSGAKYSARAE